MKTLNFLEKSVNVLKVVMDRKLSQFLSTLDLCSSLRNLAKIVKRMNKFE